MKIKKILAAGIAATLLFSCGCGGTVKTPEYEYGREQGSSNMLLFSSSDEGLDNFLNDYLHRHRRCGARLLGYVQQGVGGDEPHVF